MTRHIQVVWQIRRNRSWPENTIREEGGREGGKEEGREGGRVGGRESECGRERQRQSENDAYVNARWHTNAHTCICIYIKMMYDV